MTTPTTFSLCHNTANNMITYPSLVPSRSKDVNNTSPAPQQILPLLRSVSIKGRQQHLACP